MYMYMYLTLATIGLADTCLPSFVYVRNSFYFITYNILRCLIYIYTHIYIYIYIHTYMYVQCEHIIMSRIPSICHLSKMYYYSIYIYI